MLFKKFTYGDWPYYDPNKRNDIPAEIIDKAQKFPASDKYSKKVMQLFYQGYPEMPYVSKDRELYTLWLTTMTGNSPIKYDLVEKKMMKRYADGLLPGHIKMLKWLQKPRKRVPAYFEYKYGVNFWNEKQWLIEKEYLDKNEEITEKGLKAIQKHKKALEY